MNNFWRTIDGGIRRALGRKSRTFPVRAALKATAAANPGRVGLPLPAELYDAMHAEIKQDSAPEVRNVELLLTSAD